MYNSSQAGIVSNVHIRSLNTETGETHEYHYKNRVTNKMLLGIAKLISGEYLNDNEAHLTDVRAYVPSYIALGEGDRGVSVDDASLSLEFSTSSADYKYHRLELTSRSYEVISGSYAFDVRLTSYCPSALLDNPSNPVVIKEVGLFVTEDGSDCIARVNIPEPYIEKAENTVLDIVWTIRIISIGNQ